MQFAVRTTSRDRSWTGFDAAIYETTSGRTEIAAFTNLGVIMHVEGQRAGEFAIVSAGHSGEWVQDGPATLLVVDVSRSLVRSAARAMNIEADAASIQTRLHLEDPRVAHIGWALEAELETGGSAGHLYPDSLGLALAAHLLRHYSHAQPRHLGAGFSKHRLARVLEHIRDHLAGDLRLAELAGIAGVSPSHFKIIFKEFAGMPVHQYVVRRRVDYAAELLRCDNLPLAAVALQAGFADQSHMSRCMRRVAGTSPQTIRRAAERADCAM